MTTGAIRDHFRTHSRCEAVVAVLITTDALAGDSKFLGQNYAFVTPRAGFRADVSGSDGAISVNGRHNIMNAMAISAHRRSRHATHYRLSMNALHELCTLALVALAAGGRNVDLGNRRLWIRSRKDVVTVMTIGTDSGADIASCNGLCVHTLSIRKKRTIADTASLHD